MNRKGFSLVELLVAIAILALLALVIVPNVFTLVEKNNINSCENLKRNIESAAKTYVSYNKYDLNFLCPTKDYISPKTVTLQTLIDRGDLETDKSGTIKNPVTDEIIPLTTTITIVYHCGNRTFTYNTNNISCTK